MLMLVRITAGGKEMPPMSSKTMDKYCEDICIVLWDDTKLLEHAKRAADNIDNALSTFTGDEMLAKRLRSFTTHLVPSVAKRPEGEVKYYNLDRGFGFITSKNHEKDIFVHFSAIKATMHRYLQVGQHVEFDVVQTEKGLQAENVTVVGFKR